MTGTTSIGQTAGHVLDGLEIDDIHPSVLSWRDLAHSATPVVALERPVPGIARCVIAPVPLLWLPVADRPARHPSRRVRCLAVDDSGRLAAPELIFTGDAEALLACICHYLSLARRGPTGSELPLLSDTVSVLRDPAHWRLWARGGADQPLAVAWQWAMQVQRGRAQYRPQGMAGKAPALVRRLGRRLQWCVDWVIGGLPVPLATALLARPDLSHALAHGLLARADVLGGAARRYAEQALLCEPLPTLRWMADGGCLAQALFAGRSLPRELCRLAQIGAASVRHASRQAKAIPDLPLPVWTLVLAALDRMPAPRRPHGSWQWGELVALARGVARKVEVADPESREVAIDAVLAGAQRLALGTNAGRKPDDAWQSLFTENGTAEELAALVYRMDRAASGGGPLAALRRIATATATDAAGAAGAAGGNFVSRLVSALGKGTAREFGHLWLELLPATPPLRRGQFTVRLLRSMVEALDYGRALRNCLRKQEMVLTYLVALRCLVAVEGGGGQPLALVAVLLERTGADLLLQTEEVLGVRNQPSSAEVVSAAEEFVDRLAGQSAQFEHFVRVGEALGRLGRTSVD